MTATQILDGLHDRIAALSGLEAAGHSADVATAAAFVRPEVEAVVGGLLPGEVRIIPFTIQSGAESRPVALRVARERPAPQPEGQPAPEPSFRWD